MIWLCYVCSVLDFLLLVFPVFNCWRYLCVLSSVVLTCLALVSVPAQWGPAKLERDAAFPL